MLFNIASVVLALQLGIPGHALSDGQAAVQEIQYRVPVRPPPCDHGWDVSARDGMCYPNGYLPPQELEANRRGYPAAGAITAVEGTQCRAGTVLTSISGTDNAIPTGWCPRSFRRVGFALGTTDTSPPA